MINKFKRILNKDLDFKELLTGSAITFVLKMSGMLLGYIVILMISRQFGAEGVGIYNLSFSLLTFLAMISCMGMNVSILRYVGQFNKNGEEFKLKLLYKYAIQLALPFSILISIAIYFSAEYIALNIFKNETYIDIIKFISILIPFMTIQNISVEFIRGLKKLKISEFLRSVLRPIIIITLLIIFSLSANEIILPIYFIGVSIFMISLFSIIYIYNKIKLLENNLDTQFTKKELINTSMPMMITTISAFIMGNISLFLLEIYSTTENVGLFSIAFKIATLISLVLTVVNTISAPKFSELFWNKKYTQLQKVISKSTNMIFISSLIVSTIIILFSKDILSIFGEEFITANYVLILLVIGQLINSATGSVGVFLNMTGNQKILKNIVLLAMITTIILNILLIPYFNIIGAAIATMVGAIVLNITSAIYTKNILGYITYFNIFKGNINGKL